MVTRLLIPRLNTALGSYVCFTTTSLATVDMYVCIADMTQSKTLTESLTQTH